MKEVVANPIEVESVADGAPESPVNADGTLAGVTPLREDRAALASLAVFVALAVLLAVFA